MHRANLKLFLETKPMAFPAASSTQDEMRNALRSMKGTFFAVAVFSGFLNLLMLAPALYMLQVYDRVLGSRNEATLWALTGLVVGAFVFLAALETIRTWVLVRVGARLDSILGQRVFNASFEHSLVQPGSNAAQPMHDLNTVRSTLTGSALLTLLDAPWLVIYLVVIFTFSLQLGVFAVVGAMVLVALTILNEVLTKKKLNEAQKVGQRSQLALASQLRHSEVIEALGMLEDIRRRWHVLHRQQLQLQASASDDAAVLGGLTRFVRITMQSLSLGLGALLVLEGTMTAGVMIAASILVSRALAPAELLVGNWRQIVAGRSAWARLRELLHAHPPRQEIMKLPEPTGKISVEGASVAPPGSRQLVLRQLSFSIDAGEVVAVVGPSGSGKSSLARALVGVWPTAAGAVRLDGAEVHRWPKAELGPRIGYLPQDIELFDGTVAENIARFGQIDPEKVVEASRRVGMHELVLGLPQGYDTHLGPDGGSLSGGLRQRVGLARALYGDPALVVLDEPNSNLDDMGERALTETIQDLRARGRTTVLITHRTASLAAADKIMVLKAGAIVAMGSRDEVLAALQNKGVSRK